MAKLTLPTSFLDDGCSHGDCQFALAARGMLVVVRTQDKHACDDASQTQFSCGKSSLRDRIVFTFLLSSTNPLSGPK